MRVVPELYCADLEANKAFFVNVLGFSIKYERRDEEFACLTRSGVDLMLEGLNGTARKWLTGKLEFPFGRGINLQWDVCNIDEMYQGIATTHPESVYLALESKPYVCGDAVITQKQFIVQSPDGYLFRFCEETE